MDKDKLSKSLSSIADAAETGYTSLFTFAVKENLSSKERMELVNQIRHLADEIRSEK